MLLHKGAKFRCSYGLNEFGTVQRTVVVDSGDLVQEELIVDAWYPQPIPKNMSDGAKNKLKHYIPNVDGMMIETMVQD